MEVLLQLSSGRASLKIGGGENIIDISPIRLLLWNKCSTLEYVEKIGGCKIVLWFNGCQLNL